LVAQDRAVAIDERLHVNVKHVAYVGNKVKWTTRLRTGLVRLLAKVVLKVRLMALAK